MFIRTLIVILVSSVILISCAPSADEFANELVTAIKDKDVNKLYSLHISGSETAQYGFYAYGMNPVNMGDNNLSFEGYVDAILKGEEEEKPGRLEYMQSYIDRQHRRFDWSTIQSVSVQIVGRGEKEIMDTKHRRKVDIEHFDLKISMSTKDGSVHTLTTPYLVKLPERWVIYGYGKSVPIDLDAKD